MRARARSTARSRRLALAVACVVVAFFGNRAREANADAISDVRAQCANALAVDDPPCAHGTMPVALSSPHPDNCASCAVEGDQSKGCPGGWSGTACGVCQSRDVCGTRTVNGVQRRASACTSKCWTPTEEELHPIGETNDVGGKVFFVRVRRRREDGFLL